MTRKVLFVIKALDHERRLSEKDVNKCDFCLCAPSGALKNEGLDIVILSKSCRFISHNCEALNFCSLNLSGLGDSTFTIVRIYDHIPLFHSNIYPLSARASLRLKQNDCPLKIVCVDHRFIYRTNERSSPALSNTSLPDPSSVVSVPSAKCFDSRSHPMTLNRFKTRVD
jgi:hypothetical protein